MGIFADFASLSRVEFQAKYRKQEFLTRFVEMHAALSAEVSKVMVGQCEAINDIIDSWVAECHVLLKSVPGLGKTLVARTIGQCVQDCPVKVQQWTVDTQPADIRGFPKFNEQLRVYAPHFGPLRPIFGETDQERARATVVYVGDEINRGTMKAQGALLNALEEGEVNIGDETYPLHPLFFGLFTMNPIEQGGGGTYRIIEALRDRVGIELALNYLPYDEEKELGRRSEQGLLTKQKPWETAGCRKVVSLEDIAWMRAFAQHCVEVPESVHDYATTGVRATRLQCEENKIWMPEEYRQLLSFGSSSRGLISLLDMAKVAAARQGLFIVNEGHIKQLAPKVLGHRLIWHPDAEYSSLEGGVTANQIVEQTFAAMDIPMQLAVPAPKR
jgi:MoxR-like ATPase